MTKKNIRSLVSWGSLRGLVLVVGACSKSGAGSVSPPSAEKESSREEKESAPAARMQEIVDDYEFSASALALELTSGEIAVAASGDDHPVKVAHRPASTVKPLLYASAIESGAIAVGEAHECTGTMPGEPNFHCFEVHGEQTVAGGIASSCNIFAWTVIDQMKYPAVQSAFEEWGFGQATGLVEGEESGVVPPAPAESADPLFSRVTGFGHGELRVTGLQLAVAYGELAKRLAAEPEKYAEIRRGLRLAVEQGTAMGAQVPGMATWGKTGSAEHVGEEHAGTMDGWYVALVPADGPEVVFATHVLAGGGGAKTAAPLTKRLIEAYFAEAN